MLLQTRFVITKLNFKPSNLSGSAVRVETKINVTGLEEEKVSNLLSSEKLVRFTGYKKMISNIFNPFFSEVSFWQGIPHFVLIGSIINLLATTAWFKTVTKTLVRQVNLLFDIVKWGSAVCVVWFHFGNYMIRAWQSERDALLRTVIPVIANYYLWFTIGYGILGLLCCILGYNLWRLNKVKGETNGSEAGNILNGGCMKPGNSLTPCACVCVENKPLVSLIHSIIKGNAHSNVSPVASTPSNCCQAEYVKLLKKFDDFQQEMAALLSRLSETLSKTIPSTNNLSYYIEDVAERNDNSANTILEAVSNLKDDFSSVASVMASYINTSGGNEYVPNSNCVLENGVPSINATSINYKRKFARPSSTRLHPQTEITEEDATAYSRMTEEDLLKTLQKKHKEKIQLEKAPRFLDEKEQQMNLDELDKKIKEDERKRKMFGKPSPQFTEYSLGVLTEEERTLPIQEIKQIINQRKHENWVKRMRDRGVQLRKCEVCGQLRAEHRHMCFRTNISTEFRKSGRIPTKKELIITQTGGRDLHLKQQSVIDHGKLLKEHEETCTLIKKMKQKNEETESLLRKYGTSSTPEPLIDDSSMTEPVVVVEQLTPEGDVNIISTTSSIPHLLRRMSQPLGVSCGSFTPSNFQ